MATQSSPVSKALVAADLARLTPEERAAYVNEVCASLNLNPLTKPFAFLKNRSGDLVLYALKDCTDQLRTVHSISIKIQSREVLEGVYIVTAQASRPDGRCDESTGAVPIDGKKGDDRANAMMKAETKAKRRVTLSICGLGMLDESEIESARDLVPVVDEQRNTPEQQAELAKRRIAETAEPEKPIAPQLQVMIDAAQKPHGKKQVLEIMLKQFTELRNDGDEVFRNLVADAQQHGHTIRQLLVDAWDILETWRAVLPPRSLEVTDEDVPKATEPVQGSLV